MTTATIHHQRNYNSVGGGGRDIVGQSQGYKWSVLEKSLWTWTWWMLLLSGGVSRSWAASSNSPYANFTVKGSERFNHLVVAIHTGTVYIGAVNRIYQLSNNLQLQVTEVTGPKEDSPDCPVTQDCPDVPKKPTDNVNKALVFDYSENRIISCGSLYQGVCTAHNPFNISIMEPLRHEAVVANSPTASTVAFIAPGPPNPPTSQVLNVGVSYTGNGPYRSDVPAVSSRSLDDTNLFEISVSSVTSGTRMTVSSLERERYPITYVYGFDSRGFSYFLTTQKRHTYSEQPFISKLIRLCPNDQDYYSYTEIPIECRAEDGTDYNLAQAAYVVRPRSELTIDLDVSARDDMLFVVFAKSSDEQGGFNKPGDRSALCIYSVKNMNRKFTENIQNCFSGSGDRGLDFLTPDIKCVRTHLHIGDDFCGLEINTPLGGQMAATVTPVITYQSPLLTSVAAIATHNYTVAFLGTATGHLKKVAVESASKAFEYSDLVVEEGSVVNADMKFDRSKDFIYVMTERMVSRLRVQECDVYKTCGECLAATDPFCGWCSLEDRCGLKRECAYASDDPLHWFQYNSDKCAKIVDARPDKIQRTTSRSVMLTIDNLPTREELLLCVFSAFGKSLVIYSMRTAHGIMCSTPDADVLPAIPVGQHYFTATLSVSRPASREFADTNVTFYDCSTYTSCTQCVSSPFPCDWCVDGHRCTHNTSEKCSNDFLVTGVNNIEPSYRSGPSFCPKINSSTTGSSEILVSSGIRRGINVKVDNIAFLTQKQFVCQFNIDGRMSQVSAVLLTDTIYCGDMKFTYSGRKPNTTVAISVIWDGIKSLDNPDNVHVLVYSCINMVDNCGICFTLSEKYQCGWCESSFSCEIEEQCYFAGAWLDRSRVCPNPRILWFTPESGPLEGGTRVTIHGINLGKTFDDIKDGVTVGEVRCAPVREEYVRASKIVCDIGMLEDDVPSGPVFVKVQGVGYRTESTPMFRYVNPKIKSFEPTHGPISGGTRVIIRGEHMNAGSKIRAYMNNLLCEITVTTPDYAECFTSRADNLGSMDLRMQFDGGVRKLKSSHFRYVEDPIIKSVETGTVYSRSTRGIPSGGIAVTVRGKNLDAVKQPKIFIRVSQNQYERPCEVESPVLMKCRSPTIPAEELKDFDFDADRPLLLDYGFAMDNVTKYRNMSRFMLFPDPKYHYFEDKDRVKFYNTDYLTINGENLDSACDDGDVRVEIGTRICNVTSLSRSQLTCRPPTIQPSARNANGSPDPLRIPDVVVIVGGGSLNFTIGKLRYKSPGMVDGGLPFSLNDLIQYWKNLLA